jgi:pimeloyl-ACP methyl ester carboxylesterase
MWTCRSTISTSAVRARRSSWCTDWGATPSTGWTLYNRSAALGANEELVRGFVEKLFDEPVVLIGNSMGGHISILVGADHPELVSRLVLVDPAVPGVMCGGLSRRCWA